VREVLAVAELDPVQGLVGDRWKLGDARVTEQITLMNSRTIALLAQRKERWPLAGDQLYVDLDLSLDNVLPGTRLSVGSALLEASPVPHTGCKKFRARYGLDAVRFVGSTVGKQLQLRGINATVIQAGQIRVGDAIRKL
jgi:MOSC domain-containing protein YiiM